MDAGKINLLKFLKDSPQLEIPIFQRTYSWTKEQCEQLWDDILQAGSDSETSAYFIGSIVYILPGVYKVLKQKPLFVIDGQQRLATISLIIEALARRLENCEEVEELSPQVLRTDYLCSGIVEGADRYKLSLSQADREVYMAILDQSIYKNKPESDLLIGNFSFFNKQLKNLDEETLSLFCRGLEKLTVVEISLTRGEDNPQLIYESMNSKGLDLNQADLIRNFVLMGLEPEEQTDLDEETLSLFCRGLEKLTVVEISLTRGEDNPQLIYESMNSKGLDLNQADLIRNFVLMGLEPEEQTDLYNKRWRPMERSFGKDRFRTHFDDFVRHYLTIKTVRIPARDRVYKEFQKFRNEQQHLEIDTLLSDLHQYANYYCSVVDKESEPVLESVFRDIRELRMEAAYPLLLELYMHYDNGDLPIDDFVKAVRYIESHVFRRFVVGEQPNALRPTFAEFSRSLQKDNCLADLQTKFQQLQGRYSFPDDARFQEQLKARDLYNITTRYRKYLLRKLENHGRKEPVNVDDFTIEHILPQNENLSPEWREAIGENWEFIQERFVHTLGNLTLTGYNSEYSDRPFREKRDMKGGFKNSPLYLNQSLRILDRWDLTGILERGTELSHRALEIWINVH